MPEGGKIVDHINEFLNTMETLNEDVVEMADEICVIILLSSLPSSFENFVVAIEERDNLLTFSSLKVKLLEEGARQNDNENEASGACVAETLMQPKIDNKYQRQNKETVKRATRNAITVVSRDILQQNADNRREQRKTLVL